jgi:heme o synthase
MNISIKAKDYWELTKPRVTKLAVFCAIIGMFLSSKTLPSILTMLYASIGIWLLSGSAFAFNCLFEHAIDAKMSRTSWRASASKSLSVKNILIFASIIGIIGAYVLYVYVNALTMWLTLATFFGYAIIYTLILKPITPQNIVIGGLSGAMPPALGWAAVQNSLSPEPWLLVLIIFCWTPPHFWALSLYRVQDYAKTNLPMLPITHGQKFTCLHMVLYTYILSISTFMPFLYGMSGYIYLIFAIVLNILFLYKVHMLYKNYSDTLSRHIFKFSILYLALLFLTLLVDHFIKI